MPELKRITTSDVTEALVAAMEDAGDIETFVLIYQRKGEGGSAFYTNKESTWERLNWLVDRFKCWLHNQ